MQIFAILFLYIQSWIFRANGRGFWLIDMFGHVWMMTGDPLGFLLIIFLADGWGTFWINMDQKKSKMLSKVGALLIFRYVWALVSWYRRGSEDLGEHVFEGVSGYFELIMMAVKYGFYLSIWWQQNKNKGPKNGIETKHWRRLDNAVFLAAFVSVVVRTIGIFMIDRF
jgi:hypothetical protein